MPSPSLSMEDKALSKLKSDSGLELYFQFGVAFQKERYANLQPDGVEEPVHAEVRYLEGAGKMAFKVVEKLLKKMVNVKEAASLCMRLRVESEVIVKTVKGYQYHAPTPIPNDSQFSGSRLNLSAISASCAGIIYENRVMKVVVCLLIFGWAALWLMIHWYLMIVDNEPVEATAVHLLLSLPIYSLWRYGDRYLRKWLSGITECSCTAELVLRISNHLSSIIQGVLDLENPNHQFNF